MMEPQAACQSEPEDAELFAQLRHGDRSAFDALCRRHGGFVRTVIRGCWSDRDELDDLSQLCWLRVWQRASRLRDPSRWRAWLVMIARNTARDGMRKARRRRKLSQSSELAQTLEQPAREESLREEEHAGVLEALGQLPEKYRLPLMLRVVEQWNYDQIGQAMGLSRGGVESRLYRARKKLASLLKA